MDDNSLILTFREGQTTEEALREAHEALSYWKDYYSLQEETLHLKLMSSPFCDGKIKKVKRF